jgi:hypothetical protein
MIQRLPQENWYNPTPFGNGLTISTDKKVIVLAFFETISEIKLTQ